MNKLLLILAICLTFNVLSAQGLVFTPTTQTVSASSGQEVSVNVTVSRSGNSSAPLSYFLTPCQSDEGLIAIDWANGSLNGGQNSTITIRFKRSVTSDASFTYKFKKDLGLNCTSDLISITVNYVANILSTCNTPIPTMSLLNSTSVTFNKITLKWQVTMRDWPESPGFFAINGALKYRKQGETTWVNVNDDNLFALASLGGTYTTHGRAGFVDGLLPETTYEFRGAFICADGNTVGPYSNVFSVTTHPCPVGTPTNLNASLWSGTGYHISFTPVSGLNQYGFEYIDLVNNNSGTGIIYYSSTANEGNNTDTTLPLSHDFKFRLINSCSGVASEWKTITAQVCDLQAPSNPILTNYCGYGSGGTCGYGRFTWTAVSGANRYEVEYILYNLSGQTITGTFQTASTTHVQPNMYTNGTSNSWFAKFRVRSRCTSNIWSTYGEYTIPTPW